MSISTHTNLISILHSGCTETNELMKIVAQQKKSIQDLQSIYLFWLWMNPKNSQLTVWGRVHFFFFWERGGGIISKNMITVMKYKSKLTTRQISSNQHNNLEPNFNASIHHHADRTVAQSKITDKEYQITIKNNTAPHSFI